MTEFLRIAAYQGPAIEENPGKALIKMIEVAQNAHQDHADILCFPECFLHGYFEDKQQAYRHSLDLESQEFKNICDLFKQFSPAIIFGLNERKGETLYNTAVIVENGKLVGSYRKHNTYPPYDYYTLGSDTLVFEVKGVKVGLLICYDSVFINPARELAQKGARILFIPSFNRVPNESKMPRYLDQRNHLIARSGENDCWVVVSDIIWTENDGRHCPGYACVLNSDGERVVQALANEEMTIQYDIPLKILRNKRHKRLKDCLLVLSLENL